MRLALYYPVKPHNRTQKFGENKPCVLNFGTPYQKVVNSNPDGTCPPNSDKLYPHFGMAGHNGTDLQAGEQEVRAACAGTVIEKQIVPARGLGLGIITDEPVEVYGVGTYFMKIRYWHLKTILTEVGQHVNEGDLLGISDNTGYSSANHLHFEGQPMQKDEGGHPSVVFVPGNIAGAVDIEPHFNGTYAEDVAKQIGLLKQLILVLQKMVAYLQTKSA